MLAHPLGQDGLGVEVWEGRQQPRWWRGVRASATAKAAAAAAAAVAAAGKHAQPPLKAALHIGRGVGLQLQWGWMWGAAAAAFLKSAVQHGCLFKIRSPALLVRSTESNICMHNLLEQATIPAELRVKEVISIAEPIKLQRLLSTHLQHSPVRHASFHTKPTFEKVHMRS